MCFHQVNDNLAKIFSKDAKKGKNLQNHLKICIKKQHFHFSDAAFFTQTFFNEDIFPFNSNQKLPKLVFFHLKQTVLHYYKYFSRCWLKSVPYPKRPTMRVKIQKKSFIQNL